jgi:hypothetical protein
MTTDLDVAGVNAGVMRSPWAAATIHGIGMRRGIEMDG